MLNNIVLMGDQQVESLSPFLFSLFVNNIEEHVYFESVSLGMLNSMQMTLSRR